MKRIALFFIGLFAGLGYLFSQLSSPDTLLITECYIAGNPGKSYAEITNMGKNPVDLSKYFLMISTNGAALGRNNTEYIRLSGTLQSGAGYLVIQDDRPNQDPVTKVFYPWDHPEQIDQVPRFYRFFAYDLMLPNTREPGLPGNSVLRMFGGDDCVAIGFDTDGDGLWNQSLGDIVLDKVGSLATEGGGGGKYPDVAGVTDATTKNILIRKFSIKTPNLGDFNSGQGVSGEDSHWIVIPFNPVLTGNFFNTVKAHGIFPWQVSSTSVTIEENRIIVPWGVRRDSLYKEFNFGVNMAWNLHWGPDTLESVNVQTADTFYMYLAGDEVTVKKYPVQVSPPAAGMNLVFPRLERNSANQLFVRYEVSDDFALDTISNIPFGTRGDTLLKYLEKAPNASWALNYFDGIQRPDLKTGDKLIVTAENNAKKEYFLKLNEYEPNENAALGAIYIYGDTLFGFKSNIYKYIEMLPPGSSFPAISATPVDLNATVTIERPVNIKGGAMERTATIHVLAEDSITKLTYTVLFEIMKNTESFAADPIFAGFINGLGNLTPGSTGTHPGRKGFEIFNPGNTIIPLGDYIIANATAGTVSSVVKSKDMQYRIRPGFTIDSARIGVGIYFNERSYPFITDLDPENTLLFFRGFQDAVSKEEAMLRPYVDFYDSNGTAASALKKYGFVDGMRICFFGVNNSYYLLRINNDSIFNGLKSADDPNDYTLVDIFGAQGVNNNRTIEGQFIGDITGICLERKKEIWKGNAENHGSFGTEVPGSSEWDIVQGAYTLGSHPYEPYTGYLSTVYSLTYDVSLDFGNDQTIGLVPPGTKVKLFLANLETNGVGASLSVTNADGSVIKTSEDIILQGDKLNVVSATKVNQTIYTISIKEPSHDAILTSTEYTINASGAKGTVSGIPAMTTIEELLSNVTVPAGAMLNVIDIKGQLIGTEKVLFDTLVVVKTMASDSIVLEVIAQDGVNKILYTLAFELGDPFVTSDFYMVYQDRHLIDMFQANTTVKTFLSRLVPSTGAGMTVTDYLGNVRDASGIMYKDDRLLVDDGTKTTIYYLKDMYDTFSTDATLRDLRVNGTTIEGFDPATGSYSVVLQQGSSLPVVDADASYGTAIVSVTQATDLQGNEIQRTATIKVMAEDGVTELIYTVQFNLNVDVAGTEGNRLSIYTEGKTICIRAANIGLNDEVQVFNIAGQKIIHRDMNTTFERIQITQPGGLYIVKVKSCDKIYIDKVVLVNR